MSSKMVQKQLHWQQQGQQGRDREAKHYTEQQKLWQQEALRRQINNPTVLTYPQIYPFIAD